MYRRFIAALIVSVIGLNASAFAQTQPSAPSQGGYPGSATTRPGAPYGSAATTIHTNPLPHIGQGGRLSVLTFNGTLSRLLSVLSSTFGRNIVNLDPALDQQPVQVSLQDVSLGDVVGILSTKFHLSDHVTNGIIYLAPEKGALAELEPVTIPLRNAFATEVAANLQSALQGAGTVMADSRTNSIIYLGSHAGLVQTRKLVATLDEQDSAGSNMTVVLPVNKGNAAAVADRVRASLGSRSGNYTLVANTDNNTIIVTGPQGVINQAKTILKSIDTSPHQVDVRVTVYDVTPRNDQRNIGLLFGGISTGNGGSGTGGGTGGTGGGSSNTFTPNVFGFALSRPRIQVNAQLNALISEGSAQVLASPNTIVADGKTGSIIVGQTFPSVFQGNGTIGGTTVTTVNTGVILTVTPTSIGADGTVNLDIHAEYSQITGFVQTYPIIGQRKNETSLVAHSGESIVFGGLTQSSETSTKSKVPLLGDIPLFGKLFSNTQTSNVQEEIIFQITPIVETEGT